VQSVYHIHQSGSTANQLHSAAFFAKVPAKEVEILQNETWYQLPNGDYRYVVTATNDAVTFLTTTNFQNNDHMHTQTTATSTFADAQPVSFDQVKRQLIESCVFLPNQD